MLLTFNTRKYKYDNDIVVIYFKNKPIYFGLYDDFEERELHDIKNKIKKIDNTYRLNFEDDDMGYEFYDKMQWDDSISGYRLDDILIFILNTEEL